MTSARFQIITSRYRRLRVAVVGDFCLDRYLEIDPRKKEVSIETGLPVYNVTNIRSQPGGAGTILNNLVALGIGEIFPVGFAGEDGEGFELRRALQKQRGVNLKFFISTTERRTFTYTKPLVTEPGRPPHELNRLDIKNWTRTPLNIQKQMARNVKALSSNVDAIVLMDQVDLPETGVVTRKVLQSIQALVTKRRNIPIIADSRRSLKHFPSIILKMNSGELATLSGTRSKLSLPKIGELASRLARKNYQPVFVTLSERGILAAAPTGHVEHVPTLPTRGEIDVVGAGDAVTANLISALAARATLREAVEMANAAASIVIHQLGTTGVANTTQIRMLLRQTSGTLF